MTSTENINKLNMLYSCKKCLGKIQPCTYLLFLNPEGLIKKKWFIHYKTLIPLIICSDKY